MKLSCPNGCGVLSRKVTHCPECGAMAHRLQDDRRSYQKKNDRPRRKDKER